jgi:hypothetical protein
MHVCTSHSIQALFAFLLRLNKASEVQRDATRRWRVLFANALRSLRSLEPGGCIHCDTRTHAVRFMLAGTHRLLPRVVGVTRKQR